MFITFEGIEGCGKSTALRHVADALAASGEDPLRTFEPGGCPLGRTLRAILLNVETTLVPRAELQLFLADRAQHVAEVIRPALAAGRTVLCDRFADSTLAYQGYARNLDIAAIISLNDFATGGLVPDLTLLLDLPVETGLARALARNRERGLGRSEGRFDSESIRFHTAVREGFLDIARRSPRVRVIDATLPEDEVARRCLDAIRAARAQRS